MFVHHPLMIMLHRYLLWASSLIACKLLKTVLSLPSRSPWPTIHYFLPSINCSNVKILFTQSSGLHSAWPSQYNLLLQTSPICSKPNVLCKCALVILSCNLIAHISLSIFNSVLYFLILYIHGPILFFKHLTTSHACFIKIPVILRPILWAHKNASMKQHDHNHY